MDNVTGALGVIAAVLGILMTAGLAMALVRGSYSKARIEALRGDNQDLRDRVKDLEASDERHLVKEKHLEQRCEHLENENKMLMEMVTQRAEVAAVAEQLTNHHEEAMRVWQEMAAAIERMGQR